MTHRGKMLAALLAIEGILLSSLAYADSSLTKFVWPANSNTKIDDVDQGDWEGGSRALFKQALIQQLAVCMSGNQQATVALASDTVSRARWCTETTQWFLSNVDQVQSLSELFGLAKQQLDWYKSTGKPDTHEVQFTGYYYPVLHVKAKPDAVYRYPIYQSPKDLVQVVENGKKVWRRKTATGLVPYYTRAEIVAGALKGMNAEIAYANNPIDPFVLQIQGSGALMIDDGTGAERRQIVNYASQNGFEYMSIGKLMRADGVPEEYLSLQGERKFFTEVHPELWEHYSNQDQSFVFFSQDTVGPFGTNGAVITPKHSIAVDSSAFPLGLVGLIQTQRPDQVSGDTPTHWKDFSQLVIAQDTGGAIQSPGRVDIFWGEGSYAEVAGGHLNNTGNLLFAVVKARSTIPHFSDSRY